MTMPGVKHQSVRIDTDHAVEQLMTNAAKRVSRTVRVRVHADRVVVAGTTDSWYEKQLVQESLRSVSGSHWICNEIAVNADYGSTSAAGN